MSGRTPSQTVGPYFAIELTGRFPAGTAPAGAPGAIRLRGRVLDGAGDPVNDAMVELWQAAPSGRYAHPDDPRDELSVPAGFTGFARTGTEADGSFEFTIVKPGQVPWPEGGLQAPHLEVGVLARGLLKRLVTRLYFPDEEEANAADPFLSTLEPGPRATLVAVPDGGGLRFDVVLQGKRQTAFFAV